MNFVTLKRSHLKRNIIIGVVAVLLISAIILNFTRAKYRVTQSIPLVNGTINYSLADINIVAITVDGEPSDTIPDGNYNLLDTSYCTVDGEEDTTIELSYDSATKNFTITPFTTKGTKCYLDFEEVKTPASEIIAGLVGTSDEVVLDEAGNARYIGADPNNYVYFNCDDYNNPSSSTCELWRIMGALSEDTHGQTGETLVKLIRSESIGEYAWNSGGTNDWITASLQESLNGSYLSGTTYLGSGKGITSATNDMIETVTWKLGGTANYQSASNGLASHFYGYERGETVYSSHKTTWTGKIGLMYPSDYGYATSGGSTTNRSSCLAKELYNWDSSSYSDCKNNDWLFTGSIQWTLTPISSISILVFYVYSNGFVFYSYANDSYAVLPSVYLKSNIAISGGDGSIVLPYTLKQS